ncbi:transmembrane protein 161B-like [Mangifera indica]|uniref:transmembrane protein 161B-like n=1 Tax=Mangifera indica TaxID=29780 RepID=UPI001CFAE3C2|nr:transmembrane protein 161B-like [Mangifera indica]
MKRINDSKGLQAVTSVGDAENLVGNIGFAQEDFNMLRHWFLLLSGIIQIVALRPNLQMYLNEAVLSWYQRLHASKFPDLDFSRAKVFLHNHYLCLVVLQFFAPAILDVYPYQI